MSISHNHTQHAYIQERKANGKVREAPAAPYGPADCPDLTSRVTTSMPASTKADMTRCTMQQSAISNQVPAKRRIANRKHTVQSNATEMHEIALITPPLGATSPPPA